MTDPKSCHECPCYRGAPAHDCGLVSRCFSHAATDRPVWCPLHQASNAESQQDLATAGASR